MQAILGSITVKASGATIAVALFPDGADISGTPLTTFDEPLSLTDTLATLTGRISVAAGPWKIGEAIAEKQASFSGTTIDVLEPPPVKP